MASNDKFFELEWTGLQEIEDFFGEMEQDFMRNLEEEMNDFSMLVETGARALSHRFGGDLEQSIIAAPVRVEGDVVIGSVGSNLVYAWRRHEEPYRQGKHTLYDQGAKFTNYYLNGRGRRTREKAKWRGQLPGRKFLERAVVAVEEDFDASMTLALERTIGGSS